MTSRSALWEQEGAAQACDVLASDHGGGGSGRVTLIPTSFEATGPAFLSIYSPWSATLLTFVFILVRMEASPYLTDACRSQ